MFGGETSQKLRVDNIKDVETLLSGKGGKRKRILKNTLLSKKVLQTWKRSSKKAKWPGQHHTARVYGMQCHTTVPCDRHSSRVRNNMGKTSKCPSCSKSGPTGFSPRAGCSVSLPIPRISHSVNN